VPGESWNIRDMDMFIDLPALGLFKLAGGALLVIPKPEQVMDLEVNVEVVPQPVVQNEDPAPNIYAADEKFYVIIRAGQPFRGRRLDLALLKQTAPFFFLYAMTYPVSAVLFDISSAKSTSESSIVSSVWTSMEASQSQAHGSQTGSWRTRSAMACLYRVITARTCS
jgi:hypothetical protein